MNLIFLITLNTALGAKKQTKYTRSFQDSKDFLVDPFLTGSGVFRQIEGFILKNVIVDMFSLALKPSLCVCFLGFPGFLKVRFQER